MVALVRTLLERDSELFASQGHTSRDGNITVDQSLISVPQFSLAEIRNIKYKFFFLFFLFHLYCLF